MSVGLKVAGDLLDSRPILMWNLVFCKWIGLCDLEQLG